MSDKDNNMFSDEGHKFVDRQSIEGYMSDDAFSHHKFNQVSVVKKSGEFNDFNAEIQPGT